jgi:hypothetical protein
VPVFVGEFAPSLPTFKNEKGGERYLADLLDLLVQYEVNFTYYTYHALFEDYDGLPDTVYNAIEVLTDKYCALTTDISDNRKSTPFDGFALYANYPNPFTPLGNFARSTKGSRIALSSGVNPGTVIGFLISVVSDVELAIYDVTGRRVRTLVHGKQNAGLHTVSWDGRDSRGQAVASGIYFYRLVADGQILVRRMVVIR